MLNRIFDPNNTLFRALARIFDTVMLGGLWIILSLPVITVGPATAALYYAVVKCIRRGEGEPYRNFFHAFRQNFKVGTLVSVIAVVGGVLLLWGRAVVFALASERGGDMIAVYMAYSLVLVIPLGALCYVFPLLSRFQFTTIGLIRASFRISMTHLPSTIILVLLLVQTADIFLRYWMILFLPLALCPGIVALIFSLFLERIFKPLSPEEPISSKNKDDDAVEAPWYLR